MIRRPTMLPRLTTTRRHEWPSGIFFAMNASTFPSLPVAECFAGITAAIGANIPVVLKAPPGAGKTTGVPPELIRQQVVGDGQILLIQPRRIAARAAASQLAQLLGTQVGHKVGYHVRFDKQVSAQTQLIAMTTGVLLRRMATDPFLDNVSCVILDEFHERSLELDLALGMLHRIRTTFRPELKLIVMSATLDPEPIVAFLGDAQAFDSEGRSYPVEIRYCSAAARTTVADQVAAALPSVLRSTSGHVLVFLPGVGEIRSTRRAIETLRLHDDSLIYELFGSMSPRDQDAVLAPSDRRKLILATNVAETSITIPGVTAVVDSGLARVSQFDARVGLPKLQLEPISQASADQRAGRAGRTAPGCCVRLWPEVTHRSRRLADTPEIQRADFSSALLTLATWGERDVFDFPWLTPPLPDAVEIARDLLQRLGAIDQGGQVTALGQQMLALPLHPRLARLVIEAAKVGEQERAALAAALLTERSPFAQENPQSATTTPLPCDLLDRVNRLQRFRDGDSAAVTSTSAARQILQVANQISRSVETSAESRPPVKDDTSFQRSLLAAYPDRVARLRPGSQDRGVLVGGRGVKLDRSSSCRGAAYFLCLDIDSAGTEALVRIASAVDETWLDERLIRQVDEPFFHPSLQAVVARRRRYYDDLLLYEAPIECQPSAAVAELLLQQAAADLASVLPVKDQEVSRFIARVRFLCDSVPDANLAPLDDAALREVLQTLCQSRTSFAELRAAPWLDYLRASYDFETLQWIDKQAPSQLTLPSGNSALIHYAAGKPPWIEVRIQELFGWTQTPRIAAGRVPVQLHLLGPNHRPQQITEDLENFWKETYIVVRKELRRRYPKHHWPEDPFTATATPRGLKPKP